MAIFFLLCLIAASNANPLVTDNQCSSPCAARCSPQCLPRCCIGAPAAAAVGGSPCAPAAKQEFTIGSVEEGETEECTSDKGFNSPSDNSEDPPGTITIPLPPTMYVPPRPGEAPKELPLPDFKLPAALLQGKMPDKSMTLEPEPTKIFADAPAVGAPAAAAAVATPVAEQATVPITAPSVVLEAKSPVAPPVPPPVAAAPAASTGPLFYPKLPPVTASEIPGRANRLPPPPGKLMAAAKAPSVASATLTPNAINLPKPPPIHLNLGAGVSAAAVPPPAAPLASALLPPAVPSCVGTACVGARAVDPVATEMANELSSRYGKKH